MFGIGRAAQQILRAKNHDAQVAGGGRLGRRPIKNLLVVVVELQRHEEEEHEQRKGHGGDLQDGPRAAPPHAMRAHDQKGLCLLAPSRRPVARQLVV